MKNLLIFATFLTLISCSHHDQKIKFDLNLNEQKSNIGKGAGIDLVMIDDRSGDLIGVKEFGAEEKIKISSEENLAEFLQKKITKNLLQKGFSIGFGKTLEIHITNLEYTAKRKFFIGESVGKIAITTVVTNNRSQSILTKNFSSVLDSKHFIAPLESTDAAIINNLLGEIINNILEDAELLKKLAE